MAGLLANNYSQRNPPSLGEAMTGLLGNWGGNIEQGLLSALPVLAENDPYKIGQQLLRDGAGVGGIAWHGSPHRFSKFDMSKIGTGEGAQAYGHGLYLAENPKVAKEYAKMSPMVDAAPNRTFLGRELSPGTPEYHAGTLLERPGMTIPKAKHEVQGWIDEHIAEGRPQEDQAFRGWGKTLETLNQAKKKSDFGLGGKENLYKMNIPDETIDKMLDWDKPLSEQSDIIRDEIDVVIEKVWQHKKDTPLWKGKSKEDFIDSELQTGDDLHSYLEVAAGSDKSASEYLNSLGIPGIKYLDGNSRAAGQGSRNFVSFTPDHIEMLERNGIPMKGLLGDTAPKDFNIDNYPEKKLSQMSDSEVETEITDKISRFSEKTVAKIGRKGKKDRRRFLANLRQKVRSTRVYREQQAKKREIANRPKTPEQLNQHEYNQNYGKYERLAQENGFTDVDFSFGELPDGTPYQSTYYSNPNTGMSIRISDHEPVNYRSRGNNFFAHPGAYESLEASDAAFNQLFTKEARGLL